MSFELKYRSDNPTYQAGYNDGWDDAIDKCTPVVERAKALVAANHQDMSHYRRRRPQEKPKENILIVWSSIYSARNDVLFGYYNESEETIYYGEDVSPISEAYWWSYAYLPGEQNGKDKE